ncbi:CAP domain-containing protein [Kribbella sindirgiensis]|uniref:CAP domain-containing protein n=1 Tax=Kribbella sindirgiensis TaxID=1124744 RepID=A0A4R0J0D5_9ACTN|nr:CAP domain-containing protein [Kribbella sindirgiensis]TCC39863.1 CAP domain-containing protein [Kribbella sindirgiensis]
MTNHRRSPGNGVAGPLIASLSALVLLAGIGWFVLRQSDSSKVTSQSEPVSSMETASDDASSATPVRPTTPTYTPRRTPTPSKATSVTPKPTRTTSAPSRGSTRTPKPTTSTTSPKPTRSATPTPTPTRTTKTSKPTSGPAEAQVLDLTNQERAKAGCGPLRTNKSLTQAAEAHAADMVARHYFAHDSLDGRSPFDRMKAAGFRGGAMAENIAVGYTTAAAVVKGWMNSAGHRANILNCGYTMIGIGYDSGQVKPDWGNGSWVQDFGG